LVTVGNFIGITDKDRQTEINRIAEKDTRYGFRQDGFDSGILITNGACSRLDPKPEVIPANDKIAWFYPRGEQWVGVLHYMFSSSGRLLLK